MNQNPSMPPPPPDPHMGYQGAYAHSYAGGIPHRPYSTLAIVAFVISLLVVCFPIGLILSIVAIFSIGREERGKGLAFAGLVISALSTAGFVWVMSFGFRIGMGMIAIASSVQGIVQDGQEMLPQHVGALKEYATDSFAEKLTQANVQTWLKEIKAEYGDFVSMKEIDDIDFSEDSSQLTASGKVRDHIEIPVTFSKGDATILVSVLLSTSKLEAEGIRIGNIRLGGVAPVDEPLAEQPEVAEELDPDDDAP